MNGWVGVLGTGPGFLTLALAVFVSDGTGHYPFPTWLRLQAKALVPTVCAGVGLSNMIF